MRKVIRMGLNERDITRAMNEIVLTKRRIEKRTEQLVRRLTEDGAEIARVQIASLGAVYTGALLGSIEGFYDPQTRVGIIRANTPYAVYVEYGTGIVGAGSPHPEPEGYVYDVNGHGEAGWTYWNPNDQRFHLTAGMPARPFMYNTREQLREECQRIAKEVFSAP